MVKLNYRPISVPSCFSNILERIVHNWLCEHINSNSILILLLFQNEDLNNQSKWEYLKYEIRKYTINFSKNKAKNKRKEKAFLENKINKLEQVLDDNNNNKIDDEICKGKLNEIYDDISNGIKIRSKGNWYEYGEKS